MLTFLFSPFSLAVPQGLQDLSSPNPTLLTSPGVEAWSPNRWTAREFPLFSRLVSLHVSEINSSWFELQILSTALLPCFVFFFFPLEEDFLHIWMYLSFVMAFRFWVMVSLVSHSNLIKEASHVFLWHFCGFLYLQANLRSFWNLRLSAVWGTDPSLVWFLIANYFIIFIRELLWTVSNWNYFCLLIYSNTSSYFSHSTPPMCLFNAWLIFVCLPLIINFIIN